MNNHRIALHWWEQHQCKQSWPLYQALLETECDADGLEVLAMSAAMHTHFNILQEDMIWTLQCNDYSEQDMTIVIGTESMMLCEWPEPVPTRWETSAAETSSETQDCSFEKDTLKSVWSLVCSLGGRPRVHTLSKEYPVGLGSPTHEDSDVSELCSLYTSTKSCQP